MLVTALYNFLTASIVSCTFGFNSNDNPGKVRLTDINVLTFSEGSYTTGRRANPVQQLTCVSGSACVQTHFKPKTVQCRNQGSDGYDVQWKCEADLDSSVSFGRTDVTCEGYDYPEDPYVLRGSCGLEYVLDFVHGSSHSSYHSSHNTASKNNDVPSAFSSFISMICCVGVIVFLLWMCSSNNRSTPEAGSSSNSNGNHWGGGGGPGGGGYGGGGGMGWRRGPQPPPYSDPFDDSGPSCGFDNGCGSASYSRRPRAGNSGFGGPGFWSGLAAGGLMGYMFGGNRNRYGYNNTYPNQRYNNPFGNAGPSWSGAGSSGGAGYSGGTRSASGFGGTRRR